MTLRNVNNKRDSIIKEILLTYDEDLSKQLKAEIALLKHELVKRTIITVGTGSCGLIAGAIATLDAVKEYVLTRDIDAEIIETGCLGPCSEEPLVGVQLPGKTRLIFGQVHSHLVEQLLDAVLSNDVPVDNLYCQVRNPLHQPWDDVPFMDEIPFFSLQHRIVLRDSGSINPYDINEYIAGGGYKAFFKAIRNYPNSKVCDIIEESGLRGRGGGGFPAGAKWKQALANSGNNKFVICNADESDPGAYMDRAILEGDPHRVIEGIALAAYAIGANKAYVYIRNQHSVALKRLRFAIGQAKDFGLLGYNILDSGFDLNISVKVSPGTFVCGEETALIASMEGRRGMPSPKPPYPVIKGLLGMPTVVNNVETLANVPAIIDKGPGWFRSIGSSKSKGTKLFSLTGQIKNKGVIEVPMGTSLKDIIFVIGEGMAADKAFKALLIGGPSGFFVPEHMLDTIVDYEAMQETEITMGAGGLLVVDQDNCIVDIAKFFMNFGRNESCGKCIPCREGTRIMYEILSSVTRRPNPESGHDTLERFKGVMQIEPLAAVVKDTALCGLGRNAVNPLLSGMKWFKKEYEEHIFDRKCEAGVCKQMRLFRIDTENCTGCNACAPKCPEKAIIGVLLQPHFIIPDKCSGCGICFEVCKFSAVLVV